MSRVASAPTLYWVTGVVLGYITSELMSRDSRDTYEESALEWRNLPLFALLVIVCTVAEFLYRRGRYPGLRALALVPFIIIQLRFALRLLYYPTFWLFWLGSVSAIALTVAAMKLNENRAP